MAEGRLTGTAAGFEIQLRSQVVNSATAKHVEEAERRYRLAGDEDSVDFAMAAVGCAMSHHLSSILRRQDAVP